MADVFISYAHQDRPYADGRGLERVLSVNAPEVSFWRDSGIGAGASWSKEIETQLRAAKCVVVIWSVNSWASPWVRQEAFYGYMREILIPMCADETVVEAPFNNLQCVRNDGPGFAALIAAVRAKIASTR